MAPAGLGAVMTLATRPKRSVRRVSPVRRRTGTSMVPARATIQPDTSFDLAT